MWYEGGGDAIVSRISSLSLCHVSDSAFTVSVVRLGGMLDVKVVFMMCVCRAGRWRLGAAVSGAREYMYACYVVWEGYITAYEAYGTHDS